MKKASVVVWLAFLLTTCVLAQSGGAASWSSDLRAMVETERAFSQTSVEKGIRSSFLAFLADDGIMFRPGPVNGKKMWGERKEIAGLLTWQPAYADMSRAGDLGYTTGPWEFREKTLADKPVGYGHFITLWRKQTDGTYKFVLDIGIDNPPPTAPAPSLQSPPQPNGARKSAAAKVNAASESAQLRVLDNAYASASKSRGMVKAFLAYAAEDVRLYRPGNFPAVGREAARALLAAKPGTLGWQPLAAHVSDSADIGYTYGTYEFRPVDAAKPAEQGHYVRIWKKQRDGKWKNVLDVINPLPPPKA
jgi:ketosteroid isomerase-like protein